MLLKTIPVPNGAYVSVRSGICWEERLLSVSLFCLFVSRHFCVVTGESGVCLVVSRHFYGVTLYEFRIHLLVVLVYSRHFPGVIAVLPCCAFACFPPFLWRKLYCVFVLSLLFVRLFPAVLMALRPHSCRLFICVVSRHFYGTVHGRGNEEAVPWTRMPLRMCFGSASIHVFP